jgi:hypothetical protein
MSKKLLVILAIIILIMGTITFIVWYLIFGAFYFNKSTQLALKDFSSRYPGAPKHLPDKLFGTSTSDRTKAQLEAKKIREGAERFYADGEWPSSQEISRVEEAWNLSIMTNCKNNRNSTPSIHYLIVKFSDNTWKLYIQEEGVRYSIEEGGCQM